MASQTGYENELRDNLYEIITRNNNK